MSLDPQVRAYLAAVAAAGLPPLHTLTPAEGREELIARRRLTDAPPPPIRRVDARRLPGPAGALGLRIYTPVEAGGPGALPVLVFFHGGGWVVGNLDTHDGLCRRLANAAGCLVVSVDYRLAPEARFPAAVDDAYAATRWVAARASSFGGDGTRLAVGGDSAGGNLAAVVSLLAHERGAPPLRFQLLLYPVTDFAFDTPSYRENGEGYLLTRANMEWYAGHYLRDGADRRHPHAAPLRAADVGGSPPTMVITAQYDPLRDEGEAYAARLREAGVAATSVTYPGMIHGFMSLSPAIAAADRAIAEAGAALRAALHSSPPAGGGAAGG